MLGIDEQVPRKWNRGLLPFERAYDNAGRRVLYFKSEVSGYRVPARQVGRATNSAGRQNRNRSGADTLFTHALRVVS